MVGILMLEFAPKRGTRIPSVGFEDKVLKHNAK